MSPGTNHESSTEASASEGDSKRKTKEFIFWERETYSRKKRESPRPEVEAQGSPGKKGLSPAQKLHGILKGGYGFGGRPRPWEKKPFK